MVWSLRSLMLASLVAAAPLLACSQSSSPSSTPSTSGPSQGVRLGDLAKDFTLNDADERPVRLSDYRGKVVLFEFSAMW